MNPPNVGAPPQPGQRATGPGSGAAFSEEFAVTSGASFGANASRKPMTCRVSTQAPTQRGQCVTGMPSRSAERSGTWHRGQRPTFRWPWAPQM